MKRFIMCLITILAIALPFAQWGECQTDETTKQELMKVVQGMWQAWQNQDPQPFEQNLASDGILVSHQGPQTNAEVIKDVAGKQCQVKSFSVDAKSARLTKIDSNTYIITYKAEQDAVCQGNKLPSPVYASEVWIKHGSDWKNHFYQETALVTPAAKQ